MIDILRDRVANVSNGDFPGHVAGTDQAWSLENFKKTFKIDIKQLNSLEANFDLIGIDTSLANAFRRIMIAEVPSAAIEQVFIEMNTSVIHDEILASRLGLVPIKVSPDWLEWIEINEDTPKDEAGKPNPHHAGNTLIFELSKKCERNPNAPKNSTDPKELYINSNVYSGDLKFVPSGNQEEIMDPLPTPTSPDILLCKLRPGQEIKLKCYVVLGLGSDHAKFSPVATASYRLMPSIQITEDIPQQHLEEFKSCFSPGVISIESGKATVVDPRRDTVSREVFRHPEFADKVKLGRVRDHFIFNVESTGAMEPDEIFVKSIQELRRKATDLMAYELVN